MVICDKKPANHDLLNAAQARYLQPWRSHAGASVGLRLELIGVVDDRADLSVAA
jgi:hypothetical protein